MNRIAFTISVLAISGSALAQTHVTSPRGFENTEGSDASYTIGMYPAGRFMAFDGEQLGTAMTIKGTAYRHDNRMYTASSGTGRNWSNVELWISECNMSALSSTFSANPTTSPTKVFDNPVSWPTITGKPPKLPAEWLLGFPFTTGWTYSGSQGICLDYQFTGGVLANSATWGPTTAVYYYKDTVDPSAYAYTTSSSVGNHGNNQGCNDRGVTHVSGAEVSTQAYFYSDTYSSANYAGRLTFTQTGSYFGISTQVLTLLGLRLNRTGVPLPGVYCNKVHVDLTLPTLTFVQFSSASGSLPQLAFTGQYGVKADASLAGTELVTQAAWADTVNRSMLLSSAASLIVPVKPQSFTHKMLYSSSTSSNTGSGPSAGAAYNPVVRYTR